MTTKDFKLATLEHDPSKNLLFFRVKQGQVVDIPEISEMITYVQEFIGEKAHYAVVDFGGNLLSTTEARDLYAASPYIQKNRMADAFLVRSLSVRLVANFFIKVTRPKVRTKLFTDENSAVKWLLELAESDAKKRKLSV